jgi:hypothetical protein
MKVVQIPEAPTVTLGQLENAFQVHEDPNGFYFYNLLEKVHMPEDEPDSYFDYYIVKDEDQWPTIAYAVYGDVKLWWLVTLANRITNPTVAPAIGAKIRIYKVDIAREIIKQIQ